MKFYTIPAGPFEVNTYLVFNDEIKESGGKKEGFIIDPGGQEKKIDKIILDENIDLKFILNTHCHIDHVLMDNYFKEKYGIDIIAHREEEYILKNLKEQAEYLGFEYTGDVVIDKYLKDGEVVELGGIKILPIFTPGHSPGSMSFLINDRHLFSGDTLFKNTVGRTDILGGSSLTAFIDIKSKLLTLSDDVKVYPGHGEATTIGYERKFNPYLI
ncbi:MAG: MBL fold metallo-hydrolase [Deltaproteobacteria bacterium]|nr:MBL fold metallo-hydrolase [Deltaproteobacteria bacterium]